MHNDRSNRELLDEFNALVKGHTEVKKAIINLVNRSKLRYYQKYKHLSKNYELLEPHKILLIGKSGHGKTHLVETASKFMEFPVIKIDATELNPTGSDNGINQHKLKQMIIENAKKLIGTSSTYHSLQGVIDQTVLFIDEIDKLAKPDGSSNAWSRRTQESFLTLFDSKEREFEAVSIIFAGAFSGIEDVIKYNNGNSSIGFNVNTIKQDDHIDDWDSHAIKYGLVTELVGRIRGIYKLKDLDKDDYFDILYNILIPQKREQLLYYHCTNFNLDNQQAEKMINTAILSGQGVRSLKRQLDKHVADLEFYYEDVHEDQLLLEHMIGRYSTQSQE